MMSITEHLIAWIEAEASRGMAEGDTRDALNAIKWKIKDYNANLASVREHNRKHPLPVTFEKIHERD